jgi:hypothetical protein
MLPAVPKVCVAAAAWAIANSHPLYLLSLPLHGPRVLAHSDALLRF